MVKIARGDVVLVCTKLRFVLLVSPIVWEYARILVKCATGGGCVESPPQISKNLEKDSTDWT